MLYGLVTIRCMCLQNDQSIQNGGNYKHKSKQSSLYKLQFRTAVSIWLILTINHGLFLTTRTSVIKWPWGRLPMILPHFLIDMMYFHGRFPLLTAQWAISFASVNVASDEVSFFSIILKLSHFVERFLALVRFFQ